MIDFVDGISISWRNNYTYCGRLFKRNPNHSFPHNIPLWQTRLHINYKPCVEKRNLAVFFFLLDCKSCTRTV